MSRWDKYKAINKVICQVFGFGFRNLQRVNTKSEPAEENQKHLEIIVVKFLSCEITNV